MPSLDSKVGRLPGDREIISFGKFAGRSFRAMVQDPDARQYLAWCRNRGIISVTSWRCNDRHQVYQLLSFAEKYYAKLDRLLDTEDDDVTIVSETFDEDDDSRATTAGSNSLDLTDAQLDALADLLAAKLARKLKL